MTDKKTPSTGELWMLTGIGAGLLASHMVVDQLARFNRSGAATRMLMAGVAPFAITGWMMSQMTPRVLTETVAPVPAPSRKRVDQATDAEVVAPPRPRLVSSTEKPMSPIAAEEVIDVVSRTPEPEPMPEPVAEAEPEMVVAPEAEVAPEIDVAPEAEVAEETAEPEAAPEPVAEVAPEPEAGAEPEVLVAERPTALAGPRGDAPDDLTRLKGVGPKLVEQLHGLGYYHFDQIAAWSADELAAVDEALVGVNGRATRGDWVGQAKALCASAMH